jgi:hypothetical protein
MAPRKQRTKFEIEKEVPVGDLKPKQYRRALIEKFRADNDKLVYILRVLFTSYGRIPKKKEMDVAAEMHEIDSKVDGPNKRFTAVDKYSVSRGVLKSLHSHAIRLLARQKQYVNAALTRKSRGGGGDSFRAALILKDGMFAFLDSATAADGPLAPLRAFLPFMDPSDASYRITTRGILSTLLGTYRVIANGGRGLESVGNGRSFLKADARMANFLGPYFAQLGQNQAAAMAAAGASKGQRKSSAPLKNTKKGVPAKDKATDLWRIDSADEFFHSSLRSSIVSLGTYSGKTMSQAATSTSEQERAAYDRLVTADPNTSALPKITDENERKAYRVVWNRYKARVAAAAEAAKSNTVELPNVNTLLSETASLLGRAPSVAVQKRILSDYVNVVVKNYYNQAKAAAIGQEAGSLSPGKFWNERAAQQGQ